MIRLVFLIGCVTCAMACGGQKEKVQEGEKMEIRQEDIRRAAFAGSWYEGDADKLKNSVLRYMEHAKITHGLGDIKGLISPHAGHVYSGPVAGYAYKMIQGKSYDTVVVIAPNHYDPGLTFSSVFIRGAYETPLGLIHIDTKTAEAIANSDASDNVRASDKGHLTGYFGKMEHSLEIQLPFLQVALGDFLLVPIMMGVTDKASCEMLGKAVASAVKGKNTLIVASTDLSHFYDNKTAQKLDAIVRGYVESYDPEGLAEGLESGKCKACGGGPVVAAMMACRQLGAKKATVLNMATSGDISGDNSSVVGYMSAALSIPGENDETGKVGVDLGLSDKEKDILKDVVKKTLNSVVNGGGVPDFDDKSGKLGEEWGAFVTLTKGGKLRGCIGNIVGTQPLITTVAEMAKAAALQDSRFPKVKPAELPEIEFEISVLTPVRKITDVNEIQVGRDGIIITRGYQHGILLPQVATEYGWDRETFLEHTCQKAGLPKDAWKQKGTVIEMFSAEVFH